MHMLSAATGTLLKINLVQNDWLLSLLNWFHLQFVRCCLEIKWEHNIAIVAQTGTPLCVVVKQVNLIQLQSANFCSKKWFVVPTAEKWGLILIDASWSIETTKRNSQMWGDGIHYCTDCGPCHWFGYDFYGQNCRRSWEVSSLVTSALDLLFANDVVLLALLDRDLQRALDQVVGISKHCPPLTENSGLPIAGREEVGAKSKGD